MFEKLHGKALVQQPLDVDAAVNLMQNLTTLPLLSLSIITPAAWLQRKLSCAWKMP